MGPKPHCGRVEVDRFGRPEARDGTIRRERAAARDDNGAKAGDTGEEA
jgi:hypothetical protein